MIVNTMKRNRPHTEKDQPPRRCASAGHEHAGKPGQGHRAASDVTAPAQIQCTLEWNKLTAEECCRNLYEIGGALRRMNKFALAQRVETIAAILYPGEIKPTPIVPRTTT